jgi:hypothetical protein
MISWKAVTHTAFKERMQMKRQLFYILIMTALLGGCDSGNNSNEQTAQDNDTIIDNATIGKLQDKINNAVDGEVIDLTDFDMDDTEVVIDKRLTIKNGSLDNARLKITSNDVTLQNIKSIKNIDSNASNLTIINSKVSDLLLQSGSSRSSIDCNLIGSRVNSLTVNNMTNLLVANFDKNIDTLTGTPLSLTAPANVARELGITADSEMENSTLYDYYDTNTPAGENLIYTAKGWPEYVARYVSALYPDSFDFAADLAADEKINYYIEEESKAKNAFVNAGFENTKKARICKFYIAEDDEENLSGYNAYKEKLEAIDNVYSKFCFFDIANNDTVVSFDSDEDGIYYKADNWKKAVADYVAAFACSEDDAKMQLFGSTDDIEIEEDFGGDDSFVAIYPMDWQADDEAKWIEHVTETRCKLANLSREEIYRSDSYTWKNDESIFFIYVDEPCFYEKNEKFDADAYYYEIDLYSAIK